MGAPLVFECNSPPVVNTTLPLTYNLFLNDELDLNFGPYFSEPFDNDAQDLVYTKDPLTWPTWLVFYPDRQRIVGIANYT